MSNEALSVTLLLLTLKLSIYDLLTFLPGIFDGLLFGKKGV